MKTILIALFLLVTTSIFSQSPGFQDNDFDYLSDNCYTQYAYDLSNGKTSYVLFFNESEKAIVESIVGNAYSDFGKNSILFNYTKPYEDVLIEKSLLNSTKYIASESMYAGSIWTSSISYYTDGSFKLVVTKK